MDEMTKEEILKYEIDYFVNLVRIKRYERDVNEELDYQIKVQRNKLSTLGVNTDSFEFDGNDTSN